MRRLPTNGLSLWQWVTDRFRRNLRARVALGIGLPILLALSALSLVHYWRERHLLEDQARSTAVQLGQVVMGSLRHSMLTHDPDTLFTVLGDIGAMQTIARAEIVNLEGEVVVSTGADEVGQVQHVVEPGCMACHRFPPETRPTTAMLPASGGLMRIAVPIDNEPDCKACHSPQSAHLGVLLIDVPLRILWPHLVWDLQTDLIISAGITLLMTMAVYGLIHRLVVRRVETFRRPLADYATGNFGVRLPADSSADEIGELGLAFNQMADKLERQAHAEQERSALRQRAIVEERERIARELHDGLAQVLGYVNTKAMAIRLLLKKRETQAAERQLMQLEEAARGLFVDVREAILGLRMTGQSDAHLAAMLKEYAARFSQLSDLPVEVEIAPNVACLALPPETELQLLRIVQEALTNIRKHAAASSARVCVRNGGPTLEVTVSDNGKGFDPERVRHGEAGGRPRFGLSTMRERAEAIGAEFDLDSQPGGGTRITVRVAVKEV